MDDIEVFESTRIKENSMIAMVRTPVINTGILLDIGLSIVLATCFS
jgi:hypothetical protein